MTDKQLKNLKDRLWESADQLRANSGLKSNEYATPILGLIFLRFAQSKYSKFEADINAEYEKIKGTRVERPIHEIAIERCGYYLPPETKFDFLLNLPESADLAKATKEAMEQIEQYTTELVDTLPKDIYYSVNSEDDPLVLAKLFKVFKDIPTDVSLDIFGEIYEYFLGKFALAEGQGGGEFFTPSTVVRYMVEVLAPTEGEIFDPACGSGGMFVQTAHYIARHGAKGNDINLRARWELLTTFIVFLQNHRKSCIMYAEEIRRFGGYDDSARRCSNEYVFVYFGRCRTSRPFFAAAGNGG